jgi:hypothetical protein
MTRWRLTEVSKRYQFPQPFWDYTNFPNKYPEDTSYGSPSTQNLSATITRQCHRLSRKIAPESGKDPGGGFMELLKLIVMMYRAGRFSLPHKPDNPASG